MKEFANACQYVAVTITISAIGTGLYTTGLGKFMIEAFSIMAKHLVNLF